MPMTVQQSNRRRARNAMAAAVAAWLPICFGSCTFGPPRVEQPGINASRAGKLAMEQYDANGDGVVRGDELETAPGLQAVLPRWDTNGDDGISADEVAARIRDWQEIGIGLTSFGFTVTLNGSPLTDAVVTFEPEEFLGDEIQPASGTTNRYGGGSATIAKEDRPDPTAPPGMHLGLYKVKISKQVGGQEMIPAKYNEATVLGQEVAPNVPEILNNRVVYALSTK